MNRREFIGGTLAASVLPALGEQRVKLTWATFQPFGRNMWSDIPVPYWGRNKGDTPEKRKALESVCAADHLRFEEDAWRRIADRMIASGVTMAVMDVGEALAYPSHPELHLKGFFMAPWCGATVAKNEAAYFHAADMIAESKRIFESEE